MAFTLWNLFEAALLCLNAVCVLHEERFLAKMGWGISSNVQGFGEQPTVKHQVLNLIRSIRTVMRSLPIQIVHIAQNLILLTDDGFEGFEKALLTFL